MAKKEYLKIRINQMKEMSKQGLKNWSPKLRKTAYKHTFKPVLFSKVHFSNLSTRENIGKWAYDNLWDGTFVMLGYSHRKTKIHVGLVSMCKFRLDIISEGGRYNFKMLKNYRLFRYWFWKG